MASLFPISTQFFNFLGEPLSHGTIAFYETDTTVLKTIYDDQDHLGTLTNPLVLDVDGRVPENGVWCSGEYRVIIKDEDGVVINDINNLSTVDPFDWSTLTATVTQINAAARPAVANTHGLLLQDRIVTDVIWEATTKISSISTAVPTVANLELSAMQMTFTPTSTSSILIIDVSANSTSQSATSATHTFAIVQTIGAVDTVIYAAAIGHGSNALYKNLKFRHVMNNTTLNPSVFTIGYASSITTTAAINGSTAIHPLFTGSSVASIQIREFGTPT